MVQLGTFSGLSSSALRSHVTLTLMPAPEARQQLFDMSWGNLRQVCSRLYVWAAHRYAWIRWRSLDVVVSISAHATRQYVHRICDLTICQHAQQVQEPTQPTCHQTTSAHPSPPTQISYAWRRTAVPETQATESPP